MPQMTSSSPACASVSTRRRYFGSIPAWWTPMPARSSLARVLPKPAPNRKPPMNRLRASRFARPQPARPARQQRGRVLDGRGLGEVDDVDGSLPGGQELLERLRQVRRGPAEGQRDGADGVVDDRRGPAVAAGQVGGQLADVAERRRHQQELGVRQLQQRHLPGPAAVGLGVEVELVHHDQTGVGPLPLAQRDVGEHLGGARDHRGVGVDRRVAGEHARRCRRRRPRRGRRTSR